MRKEKQYRFYFAIVDGAGQGPAGDGTYVVRFRTRAEAERYCAGKTCYGGTPTITEDSAPRRLAERWGMA